MFTGGSVFSGTSAADDEKCTASFQMATLGVQDFLIKSGVRGRG